MSIGQMRRRILVQRKETGTWADAFECWAEVQYLPSEEMKHTLNKRATARIRYQPDIRAREHRIIYMNDAYSVLHVDNISERNQYLLLTLFLAPRFNDGECVIFSRNPQPSASGVEQPDPLEKLRVPFDQVNIDAEEWYAANSHNIALKRRVMAPQNMNILPGDIALIDGDQYKIARIEHTEYEEGTPVTMITLAQPDRHYNLTGG